ncbi:MAG: hypothetical protein IJP31_11155 [Lachnospiraceae bacterium]|nr:hypothetical protein [Lachnospiraceae bacterium]
MRGRKIISLILTIATLIFIIACLMFYNANQSYKAERGIEEAIKAYSASMDEGEIKVLTREINDAVEKKLSEMNAQDLTEEDLKELLETVIKELETSTVEYRDRDITQEEINNIANEVIKKIIDLKITPTNEDELAKLEAYKLQLDQITNLHQDLSTKLIQARTDISNLEKRISELEKALKDRLADIESRASQMEEKTASIEGNALYYEYDQDTQTLKVYGKK